MMKEKLFPEIASKPWSPRAILTGTFIIFLGPFLMVELFPAQLDTVIDKSSYLAFHNVAEFFSIMVSLAVFSVGWYTYDQSKDRHALFMGTAFLAVGLLDFMHTLSNAAMPAFLTLNSTNKSTHFWIVARLFNASAFLLSAYVYPDKQSRLLSKTILMTAALALTGLAFTGIVFFPSYLPATAVPGIGLTPLKRILEFVVIFLLLFAAVAYWKRMARTGDRLIMYYLASFIICIFSEAVFASYKTGFDTYNVLGHIYKVIAFYLIYKGVFASSVKKPYVELSDSNKKLLTEIAQRRYAEEELRRYQVQLTVLVQEQTKQLSAANENLQKDITARSLAEHALQASEERLQLFIEYAPAALAMFDRDLRYLNVSRRWRSDYRLEDRDLRGLSYYEIFPEIPETWKEAHRRGLAGEVLHAEADGFERADGSVQWIHWEIRPWYDLAGNVGGIVIFTEEITERRRAAELIQRQVGELRARNEDLERFGSASVGRELRMIELKKEVNELCRQAGQQPRYPLDFGDEQP